LAISIIETHTETSEMLIPKSTKIREHCVIVTILKTVLRIQYVIAGDTSYFLALALHPFIIQEMETGTTLA